MAFLPKRMELAAVEQQTFAIYEYGMLIPSHLINRYQLLSTEYDHHRTYNILTSVFLLQSTGVTRETEHRPGFGS